MNKKDCIAGKKRLWGWGFMKYRSLYALLIPSLIFILIFNVLPLYGIQIAFRKYSLFAADTPWKSITASDFIGIDIFKKLFQQKEFLRALRNTMVISFYKVVFLFPLPIVFAILINEVHHVRIQKGIQLLVYLPHFLSWAVVAGVFVSILSSTGIVNMALERMGLEKLKFMMDNGLFRKVIIFSSGWKETGWNSIIYFAAITGLDPQLYDSAKVDGANRFQRILYITLPGILPTIILMLSLRLSQVMDAGFAQIFVMYNPTVYESADIIGTYVYRMGLGKMEFSVGTAVGLFNSLINLTLMLTANKISRRTAGMGIW